MEKQKVKAMIAKRCRAKGGISLSSEEKYKSDTGDDMDLNQGNQNQADNKYPVKL